MQFEDIKGYLIKTYEQVQERLEAFYEKYPKAKPWLKKAKVWALWLALGGIVSVFLLYIGVRIGVFGKLPDYTDLRKIQNPIASEVYSSDGEVLGRYYIQNRTNISVKELPSYLVEALVATEDVRFYKHSGIDNRSLLRVIFKSLLLQNESSGGGSTITQQLAKNLFPRQDHSLLSMPVNKIREMIIAKRLEKVYAKEEILELYLNTVSFGEDVYGIETASKRYFNTEPKNLRLQDAAVLVGLLKATGWYNPRRNPKNAESRRNTVLYQMTKYDYLEKETYDSLKQLPLELDYNYVSHNDGLAPHFRQKLRQEVDEICKLLRKPDGSSYNLYTDGLQIHTTINAKLQRYAEEATQEHMMSLQKTFEEHWKSGNPWGEDDAFLRSSMKETNRYKRLISEGKSQEEIEKNFNTPVLMRVFTYEGEVEREMSPWDSLVYYHRFLNTGFAALDPKTGNLLAWVGSVNHKYFQYDHVTAKRQVGSTFKPIVYAAAVENGLLPCEYFPNQMVTYSEYQGWTPQNSDGKYGGFYSMKGGLTNSVNTVAVELIMETGIGNVIGLAKNMGVTSSLMPVPSIALGTADISLKEMLSVYATINNRGRTVEPKYLVRIEDRFGKLLYEAKSDFVSKQVMSVATAFTVTKMMQSVVDNGTASRLRYRYGLTLPIAGKTGTTQNQADGWFMGFTPDIVAGAWVGGSHQRVRFRSTALGQGANTALPIWGLFMQKAMKDPAFKKYQYGFFPSLSDTMDIDFSCEDYLEELPIDSFEVVEEEVLDFDEMMELERLNQKPTTEWTKDEAKEFEKLKRKIERKRKREERKQKLRNFWEKVKEPFEKEDGG